MDSMIFAVCIQNNDIESSYFDLSKFSFFMRNTIREIIMATFDEILKNKSSIPELRMALFHQEQIDSAYLATFKKDNKVILMIISNKYGRNTAEQLCKELIDEDNNNNQTKIIEDYNKNYNVKINKLDKISEQLKDTKVLLIETIDCLLKRGERLDILLDKSIKLSEASKRFIKAAKKTNRCCGIF
jgi:synaptobrevin family protein YKT6